jgi:predicted RNase H-like HicB family nuclease
MRNYFAIVHKDDDSSFGVHFPDLTGCFSSGETEDEAFENAQTALRMYAEDGNELPEARKISTLLRDKEVRSELNEGGFLISVPLVLADRKHRYNLMLDKALVSGVDHAAKIAGTNRSEFVAQAIARQLKANTGAVVITPKSGSRARDRSKRKVYA